MIAAAAVVVSRREAAYRVPAARIGAWRENPTAYDYTYLWTVHSLFYFWRDYGQALGAWRSLSCGLSRAADTKLRDLTPCYMNIINPLDVGFGEGIFLNVTTALIEYFNSTDPQVRAAHRTTTHTTLSCGPSVCCLRRRSRFILTTPCIELRRGLTQLWRSE